MKKVILSVAMILLAAQLGAQTATGVPGASNIDTSNNPSGVGFGGALGGANSTTAPTNIPSNTIPRGNNFDQTLEQQRMEEPSTNPMGGSYSGDIPRGPTATTPTSNYDTVTPRAPANTPSSTPENRPFVPAATGVGPSAPTSY
ncbi:hypothetical protein ACJVC5_12765 [Peredibacter sp. HCB2-198]|uniref:hypothetical protein n=1 Tax=Peredibacter sp. HCB2-198 TaxID=3383025 RepID=UPI0038B5066E